MAEGPVEVYDETLRDGLQGPSVIDPPLEVKKRIVHLADAVGVHHVNIGLPGAGPRAQEHATELARYIRDNKLKVRASCAARTHLDDLRPVVEVVQKVGIPVEVMAFVGTSPVRAMVEGWDLDRLLDFSTRAITFAVREGLAVTYVTEDTVRSQPEILDPLFRNAIHHGARRLCLCDTVGHCTPDGVMNLVEFARNLIETTQADIGLDWHGHNDRGLALTNTLTAVEAGVDRVHGTVLGVGERVGNAPLDQLIVNLHLLGAFEGDLRKLPEWCETVGDALGHRIAHNYPIVGGDAFRTATGVHAAAVAKAEKAMDPRLADTVYSGVPAKLVGRKQLIDVGPMSGLSNVHHWLAEHGYPPDPTLAAAILKAAKDSDRVLTDAELHRLARGVPAGATA